jgi:hypothetical protein
MPVSRHILFFGLDDCDKELQKSSEKGRTQALPAAAFELDQPVGAAQVGF